MNPRFAQQGNGRLTISSGLPGFPIIRVSKFYGDKKVRVEILRFPRVRFLKEKAFLEDNYKAIMDFLYIAEVISPCETIDEVVSVLTESVFMLGGHEYTMGKRK